MTGTCLYGEYKKVFVLLFTKSKEKKIITDRYILGKTQMEIAEEIGISQAQVSRLEKTGIENIKRKIL